MLQDLKGLMIRTSRESTAERSKKSCDKDVAKSREACVVRSKRSYDKDVAKSRESTAERSRKSYDKDVKRIWKPVLLEEINMIINMSCIAGSLSNTGMAMYIIMY